MFNSRKLHVYVSRYFDIVVSRGLLPIGWYSLLVLRSAVGGISGAVNAILMHVRSHETVILTAHTDSLEVSKRPGYAISSHPSGMTRCWKITPWKRRHKHSQEQLRELQFMPLVRCVDVLGRRSELLIASNPPHFFPRRVPCCWPPTSTSENKKVRVVRKSWRRPPRPKSLVLGTRN